MCTKQSEHYRSEAQQCFAPIQLSSIQLINWYCLFDVVIAYSHITISYVHIVFFLNGFKPIEATTNERTTKRIRALHKLGIYIVIRTVVLCLALNLQLNLWICWGLRFACAPSDDYALYSQHSHELQLSQFALQCPSSLLLMFYALKCIILDFSDV